MNEHIAVEDLPEDGQCASSDPYGAPLNEVFHDDPDDESHELKGFRKRWLKRNRSPDDDEVPSPSLAQSADLADSFDDRDPGATSSATALDHDVAVSNAFLTGMKPSTIVLPWEQPWLAPIFGDPLAAPSLSMPPDWNVGYINPVADVFPGMPPRPEQQPVFTVARCLKTEWTGPS